MTTSVPWVARARAALDRRIEQADVHPDFLDVVARAHALDPARVSAQMFDAADALAPVVDFHGDRDQTSPQQDARFDDILDDVRSAVERRADAYGHREPPLLVKPRRDRRALWWAGGAVAAAIALAVGIGPMMRMMASFEPGSPSSDQSVHMREGVGSTGPTEARALDVKPAPPHKPKTTVDPPPPPVPVPPAVDLQDDTQADPERPSRRDQLSALTEKAHHAWRSGNYAEAQRLFGRIVNQGGRGRAAEMAFADLFTLAHQTDDRAAQRKWWSGYLRRFPRGRFVDDARAGLCRTAPSSTRNACWSEYLDDLPRGVFRREAQTTIGDETP